MIPSSACPPWQADPFRPAGKSAVTHRQLHHATGHDLHISVYRWEKDKYVRETRSAQDVPSFAAKAISANDFIIEGSAQNKTLFHYWIGRKLFDGVYLIFPVIEADVDEATRNAICAKKQAEGICRIGSYDELVTLARATAAQPVRDPALGVLVAR